MTPSTMFQALNSVSLPQQSGGEVVAQQTITPGSGDVLIGVSASAWSEGAGPMSIDVWLDGGVDRAAVAHLPDGRAGAIVLVGDDHRLERLRVGPDPGVPGLM